MTVSAQHPEFIAEVANYLRRYCDGVLDTRGVHRLVSLAASIVQRQLWGRIRAAARHQETAVEQIATSVVAGLFTVETCDSPLASVFTGAPNTDDASLFLQFRAIVIRVASQELFHRWDESDAMSARLWRNLHRVILHDQRLVCFPADKPVWVCLAEETELQPNLPPPSYDDVMRILNELDTQHKSFGDLIHATVALLADIHDCQNAVQIEVLFSAMRDSLTTTKAEDLATCSSPNYDDPHLRIAIDRATKRVQEDVATMLDRYRQSGKLEPDAVDAFKSALGDLLSDCADGGPAQSYYKYLHEYLPGLALDDYRLRYRAKFEYTADAIRSRFTANIKQNYCE